MDTHTQKFKIRLGLFIAGGLALFVFAIFIIGKQKNLFNPVFEISANFKNISGLQVGNNIRFSGINVGTVDNINIMNDSTIKVDMMIRKEVIAVYKIRLYSVNRLGRTYWRPVDCHYTWQPGFPHGKRRANAGIHGAC